jgi:hypothetical protein
VRGIENIANSIGLNNSSGIATAARKLITRSIKYDGMERPAREISLDYTFMAKNLTGAAYHQLVSNLTISSPVMALQPIKIA